MAKGMASVPTFEPMDLVLSKSVHGFNLSFFADETGLVGTPRSSWRGSPRASSRVARVGPARLLVVPAARGDQGSQSARKIVASRYLKRGGGAIRAVRRENRGDACLRPQEPAAWVHLEVAMPGMEDRVAGHLRQVTFGLRIVEVEAVQFGRVVVVDGRHCGNSISGSCFSPFSDFIITPPMIFLMLSSPLSYRSFIMSMMPALGSLFLGRPWPPCRPSSSGPSSGRRYSPLTFFV